jgi:hypothetical protein
MANDIVMTTATAATAVAPVSLRIIAPDVRSGGPVSRAPRRLAWIWDPVSSAR